MNLQDLYKTAQRDYPHLIALVGRRVRLQYTNDPYTELRQGDEGIVNHIDDCGTVHVDWDCGSRLGLISSAGDRWVVIN
jgi:hypothetical protein